MQIYSESQKNALSFLSRILFGLLYLVGLSLVHQIYTQNFEILLHSLIMVIYIYANL